MKEENFNQTLFNLISSTDELVYHPFNASDFDTTQQLKTKEDTERRKKSNSESIKKDLKDEKEQEFKSIDDLKEQSLKSLKRSKRYLRHDLILKELGLNAESADNNDDENDKKPIRRIRRWNEVLWSKPKANQTPWHPLTKKLGRQPRNSLHNKLYIIRPIKKVYKNLSKDLRIKDQNLMKTRTISQQFKNHDNFNQPTNLLNFAIHDARPLANFDKNFDNNLLNPMLAASSPSPTYINFTSMEPFNYQPKMYNLKTTNPSLTEQQLARRNANQLNSEFTVNTTPKSQYESTLFIGTNQPSFKSNTASNLISNSPSSSNDSLFQRISLLNPFHTPSFLPDKKSDMSMSSNNMNNSTILLNQARSARKLDNFDSSKKEVWDTIPLGDRSEEHDFTNKNIFKQVKSDFFLVSKV